MRLNRGLLTGFLACLTILFIFLNSKSTTEFVDNFTDDINKHRSIDQNSDNGQLYRYVTPSLSELGARGRAPKMNNHVLMLTRIPDGGAELLVLILQRLQGYNAFKHIRLPPGDSGLLTNLQEELLVEEITGIIRQEAIPLTFDGDVRFFNFTKFGRQAPTFVSIVRNPLSSQNLQKHREDADAVHRNGAISYFCGQDRRCMERNNKWALKQAKANIAQWYPVIGILDYMEETLKVFEKEYPYFFKGAINAYKKIEPIKKYHFDTLPLRKKKVLTKLLADEIELYQWLQFRLLNETSENG